MLFAGISAACENNSIPEILVEDTDCDAFEIYALWVGKCDSTDKTFKVAIREETGARFIEFGDAERAAKRLVECWRLAERLESMQFKEYFERRATSLWNKWYNLLDMIEVSVKLGGAYHPIVSIMLKELAYENIKLNLRLSNLFDEWGGREGLVNAPSSISAGLLTQIDCEKRYPRACIHSCWKYDEHCLCGETNP